MDPDTHPIGHDEQTGDHGQEHDETPSDAPAEEGRESVAAVMEAAERRGLSCEVVSTAALRVTVSSGDVVMAVFPLLEEATEAVAILGEGGDGTSALVMRDGQDLFVVRRNPGVWEHFRAMGGPSAVVGSWRAGERTRFRQRHGALWKAIPAAGDLAASLGVAELLPVETPPPPPPPAPTTPTPRRTRAAAPKQPRTPRSTTAKPAARAQAPEQPAPALCPRCFVQLPLSGVCDCA